MVPDIVLFDFGGVVIRSPFELVPALESRHGLTAGSIHLRGPFEPSADAWWRELMAGAITEREYWHRQAETLEAVVGASDDPLRRLIDALFDLPESDIVRPETAELLAELSRRGIGAAVLTNDLGRFHSPDWLERMTILEAFDPLIDLSHTGTLKPDPQAYALAIERLGLPPERVLFVDDQPANIAGGIAAGLATVRFDVTDPAGSVARVRAAVAA